MIQVNCPLRKADGFQPTSITVKFETQKIIVHFIVLISTEGLKNIAIKELFLNFVKEYGSAAIIICLFLEYIGLPVSGESLMLMLGFISAGMSQTISAILFSILGTFAGYMLAYSIGYRYGEKVVLKLGRPFHITKISLDKADTLLKKHEALFIIFSRYLPGARQVVPYLCGIGKLDIIKTSILNLASSLIWCITFICLGEFAGREWHVFSNTIGRYSLTALLILGVIIFVYKFFNKYKFQIFTFCFLIVTFTVFTFETIQNRLYAWDNNIYSFVASYICSNMTKVMIAISALGSVFVLGAITVAFLAFLWIKRRFWLYGIIVAINLISVLLLNLILKFIIHRNRPTILQLISVSGSSYPSGHSMISSCFYGYLIYLCILHLKTPWKQTLTAIFSIVILAIGVSRIYLGVHYASDVFGGYLAGISWLIIIIILANAYSRRIDATAFPLKKEIG